MEYSVDTDAMRPINFLIECEYEAKTSKIEILALNESTLMVHFFTKMGKKQTCAKIYEHYFIYLYSLLLSSLEALSRSWDCENGLRVKFEWLSSFMLSPTYQAKCGLGDPSRAAQLRLKPWPSRRVWFWGRPLISGGLGGPVMTKSTYYLFDMYLGMYIST